MARQYHNLTAYYNVYWNGREAIQEADMILASKGLDDFYNVIPVFQYGSVADTQHTIEKLKRTEEKSSKTIKKHSINIRGEEHTKYIDDAYLLLAMSYFYRHDFFRTRVVLNHVVSGFAKNPEKYDAMVWTAKTYIEEGEFDMAFGLLSQVSQYRPVLRKETKKLLPLIMADYYIKQADYEKAVPYIKEGLRASKNTDQKARLYFILGQIEQKKGNLIQAYHYFKLCLKKNPPLEIAFNARLNMALCYDNKTMSGKDIEKALTKMLKDSKNAQYFGRIYYVLAEIAFKEKRTSEAVDYLVQSVEASIDEPKRQILALRRLTDYFYHLPNYVEAQKYYAMAARIVEESDPDAFLIKSRSENLSNLISYTNNIYLSDSLREIASMSEEQKLAYANKEVLAYQKKKKEEEKRAKEGAVSATETVRSNWYFYNQQSKAFGYNDFVKKWGKRSNEDFWFMSNKPPLLDLQTNANRMKQEEQGRDETKAKKKIGPEDPEYYIDKLPKTLEDFTRLDSMTEEGLYKAGEIYFEKLSEPKLAEEMLLRLLKDYPLTPVKVNVYELLCRIYHAQKNTQAYNKYAQLLAKDFGGSEQDQRINDKNYYARLKESETEVKTLYAKAYEHYNAARYIDAHRSLEEIETKYPINPIRSKVLFLKAISVVKIKGYVEMAALLEEFIKQYPEDELTERAKALLAVAKAKIEEGIGKPMMAENMADPRDISSPANKGNALPGDTVQTQTVPVKKSVVEFVQKQEATHFAVVLLKKEKINPQVFSIKLSDFNRKFFSELDLQVSRSSDMGEQYFQFSISDFSNAEQALKYYKTLLTNEYVFAAVEPESKIVFVIQVDNYTRLVLSKELDEYLKFFKKNYVKE